MNLFIKVVGENGYVIDVNQDLIILHLKQCLENALMIPVERQTLIHVGKVLANDKPINFYPAIINYSKLYLVIKKLGPMEKILCENIMKDLERMVSKEFIAYLPPGL